MTKLKYPTPYNGPLSNPLPKLEISAPPRTFKLSPNKKGEEDLEDWKEAIKRDVREQLDKLKLPLPFVPFNEKGTECYFYMMFRLLNEGVGEKHKGIRHNPYRDKDVDNLVKAAVDAIKNHKDNSPSNNLDLIKDDKIIKGIKVYKEPVEKGEEGLSFHCIKTRTFTIKKWKRLPERNLCPIGILQCNTSPPMKENSLTI